MSRIGGLTSVGGIRRSLATCVPAATLPNVPDGNWQNVMRPGACGCSRIWGNLPVGAMRGAGGCGRDASRLAAAKRRLLRAAALGALASSGALTGVDAAWGQISETLPEVTVSAPRP